jgi:hypothetical protein
VTLGRLIGTELFDVGANDVSGKQPSTHYFRDKFSIKPFCQNLNRLCEVMQTEHKPGLQT